jgi:hypothetical protein
MLTLNNILSVLLMFYLTVFYTDIHFLTYTELLQLLRPDSDFNLVQEA